MKFYLLGILLFFETVLFAKSNPFRVNYQIKTLGGISSGDYAPLWFTANKFGMVGNEKQQGGIQTLFHGTKVLNHKWKLQTGIEFAGGIKAQSNFWIHQAYLDFSWNELNFSIGSKERLYSPLNRNTSLSSGSMVEGINTRPIPQIRIGIEKYTPIPGLNNWLAFKGHIAYGWFTDGKWQKDFIFSNSNYTQNVLYHSKSLMLRLGKKEKVPLELELGIHMANQFGGKLYHKDFNGNISLLHTMPKGIKAYWKALTPQSGDESTLIGEQLNFEGNTLGSWNFALNYYMGKFKTRIYLEHYFEDPSQLFWEYGRWKDGQLGIEITLPKNPFLTTILWEGMNTKDQTSPVFTHKNTGPFTDTSMRGDDNYYNHYIYQSWQHYGLGIGNPLLPGPIYNDNRQLIFRSNRTQSHHIGLLGSPSKQLDWRMLISYAKQWGLYRLPLDKVRDQWSCLLEITYKPLWAKGWYTSVSFGLDRGNYLGNTTGAMLTLCKKGFFKL